MGMRVLPKRKRSALAAGDRGEATAEDRREADTRRGWAAFVARHADVSRARVIATRDGEMDVMTVEVETTGGDPAIRQDFVDLYERLGVDLVLSGHIHAYERTWPLLAGHPEVDAIVLECTNLPPYKAALEAALNVPVFDVLDLLRDFRKRLG